MTCPTRNHIEGEARYVGSEELLKAFTEDLTGLYQLSFLLSGDHKKAERCLLAGIEDWANSNHIFKESVHSWAKRTIIQNAIRELTPRPIRAELCRPAYTHTHDLAGDAARHFESDAVLALEDFERFVFVISVLEHYSIHECALLLGCSQQKVREGRMRALFGLVDSSRMVVSPEDSLEDVQEMNL
jgi:hypothetical protein